MGGLLTASALTARDFAPFGEVVEIPGDGGRSANACTARRFDHLAQLDLTGSGGVPTVSIFRARPTPLPLRARRLERHPLSSQLFMPLSAGPFLVVVAQELRAESLRAFVTDGRQGVNYRRGVWHHPLLALDGEGDFLMVGRHGPGRDCEVEDLPEEVIVSLA